MPRWTGCSRRQGVALFRYRHSTVEPAHLLFGILIANGKSPVLHFGSKASNLLRASVMPTRPPGIESRGMDLTLVQEWRDGKMRRFQDYLVREEPLEIRVGKHPLTVTMRTPGNDLDLAAGFLFTEGLIQRREDIRILKHAESNKPSETGNVVFIEVARNVKLDLEHTHRTFFAASSCGICGKASIDSVRLRGLRPPKQRLHLDPEVLCSMPDALRSAQVVFGRTGGLHAAGLFDARGQLVVQREDVGRHNAVDKVIGWALLNGRLPLSEYVLLVSGRGGFEIVQKAIAGGVPIVASVSAPSSLAVRLAREMGLILVGFLRGKRFVLYSGENRMSLAAVDRAG
jgi:FdhD protein